MYIDIQFRSFIYDISIGLETMHSLTSKKTYELRADMQRFNDDKAYVKYSTFSVGDEADKYELKVLGYTGNAGMYIHYTLS